MNFDKINPIHLVEDNIIITSIGDVSFCFELNLPEYNTISISKYNELHDAFMQLLLMLPENTVLHRQDLFLENTFDAELLYKKNDDYFNMSMFNKFNERKYLEQKSYLYITFLDGFGFKRNISGIKYLKKLENTKKIYDKLDTFQIQIDKAIASINTIIPVQKLEKETLLNLLDKHFNGQHENKVASVHFKPDLKIGEKKYKIFGLDEDINQKDSAVDLLVINEKMSNDMTNTYLSYMSKFGLSFQVEHIVNSYIFYDSQSGLKKELEINQSKTKAISALNRKNEHNLNRLDSFLNAVELDGAKIVRTSFNVMLFNDNYDVLKENTNELLSLFSKNNIIPTEYDYLDYPYLFLAATPGCAGHLPMDYTFMTTAELAFLYTLYEGNFVKSDKEYGYIYTNRNNNLPFKIDTFVEPYQKKLIDNRNFIVIAPSGGGKSFDSRLSILAKYHQGFDQIVINIGGDDKTVKYINQYGKNEALYIKYEEGKTLSFNPFYVENTIDNNKIDFLINFIWLLIGGNEDVSNSVNSVLNDIVCLYYGLDKISEVTSNHQVKTSDYSLKTFYNFVLENKEQITIIYNNNSELFDYDSLVLNLKKFAFGNYSSLFTDSKPELFEKKKYVEFELDNISDHTFLFPIFTLIIFDLTFSSVWNVGSYKEIFIDEAWKMFEKPGFPKTLRYLYKTIRKHDGAVGIAIQQIEDLSCDVLLETSVLGNCAIKHIYNHRNVLNSIPNLKQKLSLSDNIVAQLLSVENTIGYDYGGKEIRYNEKMLIMGSEYAKVVRIEVSKEMAVILDSEKSKLERFNELYEKNNSNIVNAVKEYLN